jgi:hypothetical protein
MRSRTGWSLLDFGLNNPGTSPGASPPVAASVAYLGESARDLGCVRSSRLHSRWRLPVRHRGPHESPTRRPGPKTERLFAAAAPPKELWARWSRGLRHVDLHAHDPLRNERENPELSWPGHFAERWPDPSLAAGPRADTPASISASKAPSRTWNGDDRGFGFIEPPRRGGARRSSSTSSAFMAPSPSPAPTATVPTHHCVRPAQRSFAQVPGMHDPRSTACGQWSERPQAARSRHFSRAGQTQGLKKSGVVEVQRRRDLVGSWAQQTIHAISNPCADGSRGGAARLLARTWLA